MSTSITLKKIKRINYNYIFNIRNNQDIFGENFKICMTAVLFNTFLTHDKRDGRVLSVSAHRNQKQSGKVK